MLQEADETFTFKNTEGSYRFSVHDILYFYSDRRKVTLVTDKGEYSFYEKLDSIEKQLESGFVRIHQRYLVNAQKVEHIDRLHHGFGLRSIQEIVKRHGGNMEIQTDEKYFQIFLYIPAEKVRRQVH